MNYDNLDKNLSGKLNEEASKEKEYREALAKATERDREKAGHKVEREVLGEMNIEAYRRQVRKEREKLGGKKPSEDLMFQIYRDAVKENQLTFKDPTNPEQKRFPGDFHTKIADLLKIEYSQLRYYTAIESDLDSDGIDAFMELDLGNGKTVDLTLDITLKPEEKTLEKTKADIILGPWENIPYENDNLDDSDEALKEKRMNRDKWDARVLVYAELAREILEKKARDMGVEKILPLSKEDIEASKDAGFKGYLKETGRAKGSAGLQRDLQMRRMKKRM